MNFLSPGLLGLLAPLLAAPLIIHLLNKGFPRLFKFPSVELIKETLAQQSRLYKWRHWILLVLRTVFLALLLLAFMRPVLQKFGVKPGATSERHVIVVVDHSLSMEHKGTGPTSRERAVHEASQLIESLKPGDRVNIVLMDAAPSAAFMQLSDDHAAARAYLKRLTPGFTRGDVNAATTLAARLLDPAIPGPEVYYISDFQRKNWANADFTALPPGAKLFFVDVGDAGRENRAILDARAGQGQMLAGETIPVEVTIGNYTPEPFLGPVTAVLDRRLSFRQEVSIGPWSEGKVVVPVPVGGPGLHLCELRLPPDRLEHDDRFHLSLAVQEKEEVLIVTDHADDKRSGAWFLSTALNPFENQAGSLAPRMAGTRDLEGSRLAGVRKMFLTQVDALGEGACSALARFVFEGGGLVYFLDGAADPANLAGIEKAMGDGTLPLKLAKRHSVSNITTGAQQLVRGDFKSRYLRMFHGVTRQNLALLEFYDYYQAGAAGEGGVLLAYGDGSPAMAVAHHGAGTLLLLNFSAGEFSSNLARQRLFPAWMQELVKSISADEPPRTAYTIGETLHTEVWRQEMQDADFMSPSGSVVSVKRELAGQRYSVTFTPSQLGFYTLGAERPLYAYAVNTSSEEADLRPIDKEVLPKEFAGDKAAHFVGGRQEFDELAQGKPLFHWFILAGVVCLMVESGFQLLLRRKVA
jgi:hypothetical protein